MSALDLTSGDLTRLLQSIAGSASVDQAVRARAEALGGEIARQAGKDPVDVRIVRVAAGAYDVAVSGPQLLAREFGALDGTADPLVGPALARMRTRSGP